MKNEEFPCQEERRGTNEKPCAASPDDSSFRREAAIPPSSLKEKTARGLFWGGISNGVQQLLNLLFGVFLARLLTPEDYGMVGMLSIFSLIASTLQESGFTAALANKKDAGPKDFNAVFWFSTLMGVSLYVILFFCAPLIADFYHTPELAPLARYSFLGFLISSTGVAHNAVIFRSLKVKENAVVMLVSLAVSGIVGVGMALGGMAYWGIATQSLVYVACVTVLRWHYSGWRPAWRLDFRPLRGMVAFSSRLLVTSIFQHINYNLLSVVLGRFYGDREVGFFNQSNKWNYMGFSVIQGMVQGVAQPVLRKVDDDRERQRRVFRKMLRFVAFVSFPCLLGLSLVAPELITIAVTDKWARSAGLLQMLCIGSAFIPLQNLYSNLAVSRGRSGTYMWNVIVQGVVQVGVAMACYPYGMERMVACYAGVTVLWTLVWHWQAGREIGLRLLDALRDVLPFLLIATATMGVTGYAVPRFTDNLYLSFMAKIVLAAAIYVGIMAVCRVQTFRESLEYFRKKKRA